MPSVSDLPTLKPRSPKLSKNVASSQSILRSSTVPCPEWISEEINKLVTSDDTLNRPQFDFFSYTKNRKYVMGCIDVGESKCAVLLNTEVHSLLLECTEGPSTPFPFKRFTIREAGDGKGQGMFARRDISPGCVILQESPALIMPFIIGHSRSFPQLYKDLLALLPEPKYKEVMCLSRDTLSSDNRDLDILATNSVAITLKVPDGSNPEFATHRAIFIKYSRINHSCGPNARYEWDPNTLSMTVTAVRYIQEGEEVTITYIPPDRPREDRINLLQENCKFTCVCKYCFSPHLDNIVHSDSAREALRGIWKDIPKFYEWCANPKMSADDLIDKHMRALCFLQQEGLEILDDGPRTHFNLDYGRHTDLIAMCYAALGDTDNFLAWIERVKTLHLMWQRDDAHYFKGWILDPSTFPVWGWKKTGPKLNVEDLEDVLSLHNYKRND